ncbi:glycoside hydrolase family 3 protein [Pseudohyphozyma bogoriensis]|nr:glycoside hydrolase family 3 protein [Pseudohyphozyma bogoriensis]
MIAPHPSTQPAGKYAPLDIEATLKKLSTKEKVSLLAGDDFWHFTSIPSAGIPRVRVSDGPNGVRGQRFFNGTPASCFPCGTGIAASWDVDLVEEIGAALGDEARAKGAHIVLGPTTNMLRSPLGGRGFESYSEDPHLAGLITSAYINGMQGKGVSACVKHFVGNDQEFERFSSDSVIGERALREIYLEPFRLAIKHSKPDTFMTSYNRINGTHVSENHRILQKILREEWGFDGMVMSDWTGVVSTAESIQAGLEGPTVMRGAAVLRQIGGGKISEEDDIDPRVRLILGQVNKAIASGIPFDADEASVDTPELRALLRKAASSATVLLKNDAGILPLNKQSINSIAVIGSNASVAVPSGGGSASLNSTYTVTPLDAIKDAAKEMGAEVRYEIGAAAYRFLPVLDAGMKDTKVEFFKKSPTSDWYKDVAGELPKADWETPTKSSLCFMIDGVPFEELGRDPLCRFTTSFTPEVSGEWEFGLCSIGGTTLFIDGKLVVDNYENFVPGEMFFGMGSEEQRGKAMLKAGQTYKLEVRQSLDLKVNRASPFLPAAAIRLGGYPVTTPESARAAAVEVAKKSDVAIVVVGTNPDWETEGYDRKTMALPGASDALVSAVLAANRNTIVVTQSGTPVEMPWADEASTLVHAFFGGNELGNGLADVLFGKTNFNGRLPITFPKRLEDNPAFHTFGITTNAPGKAVYGEGVFMGYRHYDKLSLAPLFRFGHGLSYTTFAYSDLTISPVSAAGEVTVSLTVANTGKEYEGTEVVQIYVSPPQSDETRATTSPVRELKAFKKVQLAVGEKKAVEVRMEKEAFSYYDEKKDAWVVSEGTYETFASPVHGTGLRTLSAVKAGTLLLVDGSLLNLPRGLIPTHMLKDVLRLSLEEQSPEERRKFFGLGNSLSARAIDAVKLEMGAEDVEQHAADGEKKEGEEEDDGTPTPMDSLSGTFITNGIDSSPNHLGIFAVASRMNHSCVPNVSTTYNVTSRAISIYALSPLPAGTELFTSYISLLAPLSYRQNTLYKTYNFHCRCVVCSHAYKGTPQGDNLSLESERRRKRVGLLSRVLGGWEEGGIRPETVVKVAAEVLGDGGVLEKEGLLSLRGEFWRRVCAVTAAHHSATHTKGAAYSAYTSYVLTHGEKSTQCQDMKLFMKDPRRHPMWAKRGFVNFDKKEDVVDLGLEGLLGEDKKKRKKKKKKSKKVKTKANGEVVEIEVEEEDEEESPAEK